ncbi:PaaI family thioesterase [Pseudodesulfovibrio sp.]|uniref:PaaI family thioesterase n=1 Tax=Pseudodesulfovibrio sp. TaxID=2035812 RepID=UPI00262566C1|nr:PaaI family thioesterase [Pseudodesulfovibrio sp.]MDD3312559.1 PaaI family thioesterase [Pseudodesulfovibrio sp.]
MPNEYLQQVRAPGQDVNHLFAFLGVEVAEIEPGRAVLRLPVKSELLQGAGMAAGGVMATLMDEAMAHAVLAGNRPGELTTTVDMNVSYLRAVGRGAVLTCEARVVKRGGRVVFAEASLTADGRESARATATFMLLGQPARS